MTALVIRSTQRAVEYHLFSVTDEAFEALVAGSISDIGSENPQHDYNYGKRGRGEGATMATSHIEAFERISSVLRSPTTGPEDYSMDLTVVAHHVPHGGQRFKGPALITEDVISQIDTCSIFSPLDNPSAVLGIRGAMTIFPMAPHVAVFDTAFHQSMPPKAFLYALPYELYELHGLRRFGFHGLSHRHAISSAAEALGSYPEAIKVLSVHIDEETSVAAFSAGRCVDTSSGLTVQGGLIGARSSGTVDPSAVAFLERNENLSIGAVEQILTQKSGVFGLSGLSDNLIEVIAEAEKGEARCQQTVEVVVFGLIKAIGGLAASMGGLEVLIFTGPVGVKAAMIRRQVCERLGFLGVEINELRNEAPIRTKPKKISTEESSAAVFVVPSDVARTIARDCIELVLDGIPT